MKRAYIFILALIVATTLFLIANHCGVGYTYDSYLYIEIANQVKQQGIFSAKGFYIKPPVYPFLISIVGKDNISLTNLILLLASMSMLITLGTELKNRNLKYFFWGLIVFSTPFYLVHSFAWTEPLFIFTVLLVFFCIHEYQKESKLHLLMISFLLLLLLPFIRFAGVFIFIPTLFIIYLFLPIERKKYVLFGFIGLSSVLLVVWVLRFEEGFIQRWATFVSPLDIYNYSRYTHNASSYLQALSIWVLPLFVIKSVRISCGILILLVIIIISIKGFLRRQTIIKNGIPIIFLCYYFFLHLVFPVEYYSAERYLTPLYNLLLLSVFLWLDEFYPEMRNIIKKCVLIFISVLLLYSIGRKTKNVVFWNSIRCKEEVISIL